MLDLPFTITQRIFGVLILLVIGALIDWLVKREKARRWKDYLFLIGCGAAGAVFGVLIDQVTSRVSPEYFIHGKGIAEEGFKVGVVKLGAQAGMTAGVITGGVLLVANSLLREKPIVPVRKLLRYVLVAMAGALLSALVLGIACLAFLPKNLLGSFNGLVPMEAMGRFKAIAGAHSGLYLGGIITTVVCVVHLRRKMKKA